MVSRSTSDEKELPVEEQPQGRVEDHTYKGIILLPAVTFFPQPWRVNHRGPQLRGSEWWAQSHYPFKVTMVDAWVHPRGRGQRVMRSLEQIVEQILEEAREPGLVLIDCREDAELWEKLSGRGAKVAVIFRNSDWLETWKALASDDWRSGSHDTKGMRLEGYEKCIQACQSREACLRYALEWGKEIDSDLLFRAARDGGLKDTKALQS